MRFDMRAIGDPRLIAQALNPFDIALHHVQINDRTGGAKILDDGIFQTLR